VVRIGDVDDQRLYTRPPDCICVPVVPDAREDVEPPPGQFACRGLADAARRTSDYDDLLDFRWRFYVRTSFFDERGAKRAARSCVRCSSTFIEGWSASKPSNARRKTSALASSPKMVATHSCTTLR